MSVHFLTKEHGKDSGNGRKIPSADHPCDGILDLVFPSYQLNGFSQGQKIPKGLHDAISQVLTGQIPVKAQILFGLYPAHSTLVEESTRSQDCKIQPGGPQLGVRHTFGPKVVPNALGLGIGIRSDGADHDKPF